MITFTISSDNNITAFPAPEAAQDVQALGAQAFTTQKELAKLAADWPASRLVETWNGFAGTPGFEDLKVVRRFTDRKTAVSRIWQAIQRLAPAADGGAQGAPETDAASKEASTKRKAPRAKKGAKEAKPRPEARDGSKKAVVIALMKRDRGATNQEIQQATDWQPHTVRGFISGSLVRQMNLKVETINRQDGVKAYHIA